MKYKIVCCCTLFVMALYITGEAQAVGEYINETSVQITNNGDKEISFGLSFNKKNWSAQTILPHRKEIYKMAENNYCYARVTITASPPKTDIYKLQKGKEYIIYQDDKKRKVVIKPVSKK